MIIMTKFAKKVTKAVKHTNNAIVIGRGFGYFDELIETFKTVFVLSDGVNETKGRNIVYREEFSDIKQLPYIDAVFVDNEQLENMKKLENLLQQTSLTLYIGTDHFLHPEYSTFLGNKKYEVVEITKSYQVWKSKK